jgi:TPR repeat protein
MAGTRILRALGVDADERATTDAHEPLVQLPLPTLDERASVYLRAVHGKRDFTNEEHANARDLILEAMAADIAARDTWTRDVAARAVMTRDVMTRDVAARDIAARDMAAGSVSHSPNAVLQDLESMTVPGLAGDQDIDQSIDQSIDHPQDAAPAFSQRWRHSFLSESRMLYGITAVCSAAALAAALGYWAGTLSQTARSSPDNSRLANQASPADPSGRTPSGSDPRVVAEAQRELATALNVAQLRPDEVAALLKRGQELVAQGRFRVARPVLEQAAETKNAAAALALGQTYDPLIERSAVRPDAPPDIAMALIWYEKAKDLGSPEAAQRLSQLRAAAPLPASRPAPK